MLLMKQYPAVIEADVKVAIREVFSEFGQVPTRVMVLPGPLANLVHVLVFLGQTKRPFVVPVEARTDLGILPGHVAMNVNFSGYESCIVTEVGGEDGPENDGGLGHGSH